VTVEEDMRRLEELAVSRLLEDLSAEEAQEYAALRSRLANIDEAAVESIVALAHLAILPAADPEPRNLRAAVEKDADEFFGVRSTLSASQSKVSPIRRPAFWLMSGGWWLALAASIVTVVVLLHRAPEVRVPTTAATAHPPALPPALPPSPVVAPRVAPPAAPPHTVEPELAAADATPKDLAAERSAFLRSHPYAIERAWRAGGDPTGERVVGDVVWDEASQTGYMRFVNLRRNEPNAEQYQLWIFDAQRDQRYPVDGGVFDVTTRDGEQVIAINPKLRVHVPLVFAITVEHPGGVVVSDRSRIAAIANVS
jgi:hypothetical protein